MSALTRMARSTHKKVEILPGDTVIIAANPIPGNEKHVGRTVDELFRLGANVIYGPGQATGVHVSGHGSQEELKLMLELDEAEVFYSDSRRISDATTTWVVGRICRH